MNQYARYFPWVGLSVATLLLGLMMIQPSDAAGGLKLQEAAELPINDGGRVKPLDTMARVDLMLLSGRQAFTDQQENPAPPVQWALDVMTSRDRNLRKWGPEKLQPGQSEEDAFFQAIRNNPTAGKAGFRIQDPTLRSEFGLPETGVDLFTFAQLAGGFKTFLKNAETVAVSQSFGAWKEFEKKMGREPTAAEMKEYSLERLTPEQNARLELSVALNQYVRAVLAITPHRVFRIEDDDVLGQLLLEPRPGLRYSFDEFVTRIGPLHLEADRALRVEASSRSRYQAHIIEMERHVHLYLELADQDNLRLVPPRVSGGEWLSVSAGLSAALATAPPPSDSDDPHAAFRQRSEALKNGNPEAAALNKMLQAYTFYNPEAKANDSDNGTAIQVFNSAVDDYKDLLARSPVREARGAPFETFFNHFAPFYQCTVLYLFVFLLCIGSWIVYREDLTRTAFWVMALTFVVHTWAILARMYLSGRPPVTNLYSSAVFIGWGCVGVALVLEYIFRNGFATLVGSILGFNTTIIAHYLAQSGDTLEMMQAVLDTNFWLATHVTTVTLGYTATFVAGFIGMVYIGLGVLSRSLDKATAKSLYQMAYGVVCFATLLSFVGTVLGGIWADQSWGRFWGWDPKENGALLIVLWNAIVLHARWGGMVKERGLAVLVVFGNIVTGWSWFGTNMLGIGLHSYGFMSGALAVLLGFDALFLAFIVLGMLPLRYWNSFGGTWTLPRFQAPTLPTQALPALATAGPAPSLAASTAVAAAPGKPVKNKRGKNGRR